MPELKHICAMIVHRIYNPIITGRQIAPLASGSTLEEILQEPDSDQSGVGDEGKGEMDIDEIQHMREPHSHDRW
jgi:hypothetical protein